MSLSSPGRVLLAGLALGALAGVTQLAIKHFFPVPPAETPADRAARAQQAQALQAALRDNTLLRRENARRETAAEQLQRSQDSALGQANLLAAKITRAEKARAALLAAIAADSAAHRAQDSARAAAGDTTRPAPLPWDSLHPVPVVTDSGASCEQLYAWRSQEAVSLRSALEACTRAGALYKLSRDSLGVALDTTEHVLRWTDSLYHHELTKPRPCRERVLFWQVSCTAVTAGVGIASFLGGVLTARGH